MYSFIHWGPIVWVRLVTTNYSNSLDTNDSELTLHIWFISISQTFRNHLPLHTQTVRRKKLGISFLWTVAFFYFFFVHIYGSKSGVRKFYKMSSSNHVCPSSSFYAQHRAGDARQQWCLCSIVAVEPIGQTGGNVFEKKGADCGIIVIANNDLCARLCRQKEKKITFIHVLTI